MCVCVKAIIWNTFIVLSHADTSQSSGRKKSSSRSTFEIVTSECRFGVNNRNHFKRSCWLILRNKQCDENGEYPTDSVRVECENVRSFCSALVLLLKWTSIFVGAEIERIRVIELQEKHMWIRWLVKRSERLASQVAHQTLAIPFKRLYNTDKIARGRKRARKRSHYVVVRDKSRSYNTHTINAHRMHSTHMRKCTLQTVRYK